MKRLLSFVACDCGLFYRRFAKPAITEFLNPELERVDPSLRSHVGGSLCQMT